MMTHAGLDTHKGMRALRTRSCRFRLRLTDSRRLASMYTGPGLTAEAMRLTPGSPTEG